MKDKEIFLEETDFSARFGKKLTIERIFLEYDCLPLLCVCKDSDGQLYLCHCPEFRLFERWVLYPISENQLSEMTKSKKAPAEVLGAKNQRVYVYSLCFEDGTVSLEETSVSDLQEYERLPEGEPLPYL